MNNDNCKYPFCGKSLKGMRDDARYCCESHKVLDYRRRKDILENSISKKKLSLKLKKAKFLKVKEEDLVF